MMHKGEITVFFSSCFIFEKKVSKIPQSRLIPKYHTTDEDLKHFCHVQTSRLSVRSSLNQSVIQKASADLKF